MSDYFSNESCFEAHAHVESPCLFDGAGVPGPEYSIIVPTFRRAALLDQTLASALSQVDVPNYEVVVVDNDPSPPDDATADVIRKHHDPRLRYFRNAENLGMFGNWNRGLLLARGRWATILHDDDLLSPQFLKEMSLHIQRSDAEQCLISCEVDVLDERAPSRKPGGMSTRFHAFLVRLREGHIKTRNIDHYFYGSPHRGTLGILFDRKAAISLGGFDQRHYPSADYFFFSKYVAHYTEHHLIRCIAASRIAQNDSLRDEVMVAWVKQGYEFRVFLANTLYGKSASKLFLAKVLAIAHAYDVSQTWGGKFDKDALLRQIGCSTGSMNILVFNLYKFLHRMKRVIFYMF